MLPEHLPLEAGFRFRLWFLKKENVHLIKFTNNKNLSLFCVMLCFYVQNDNEKKTNTTC